MNIFKKKVDPKGAVTHSWISFVAGARGPSGIREKLGEISPPFYLALSAAWLRLFGGWKCRFRRPDSGGEVLRGFLPPQDTGGRRRPGWG